MEFRWDRKTPADPRLRAGRPLTEFSWSGQARPGRIGSGPQAPGQRNNSSMNAHRVPWGARGFFFVRAGIPPGDSRSFLLYRACCFVKLTECPASIGRFCSGFGGHSNAGSTVRGSGDRLEVEEIRRCSSLLRLGVIVELLGRRISCKG